MEDNLDWMLLLMPVAVLGSFLLEPDSPGFMKGLFYMAVFLLVFDVLYVLCAADDYIDISKDVGVVYIYKKSNGYIMEKALKQEHDFWYINSYEVITSTYKHSALLFELSENKTWYYLTDKSPKPSHLGYRISQTIFKTFLKNANKTELKILCGNTYATFRVKTYTCEDIYVSSFYANSIKAINHDEVCEKWLGQTTLPAQYLVLQDGGIYQVLGIDYSQEYGPNYRELAIPIVIFKELNNHIIIKYQQDGYKKIYDEPSVVKTVSDKIAQFTNNYRIGGIIWKLNPEKAILEKIYEGKFSRIDFAGSITGDDGQKFLL